MDDSKEFKALIGHWYAALKACGFEDIEEGEFLIRYTSYDFSLPRVTRIAPDSIDYFTIVSHSLHEFDFENDTQREIWRKHGEGETIRNIAFDLSITKYQVEKTIKALKSIIFKGSCESDY